MKTSPMKIWKDLNMKVDEKHKRTNGIKREKPPCIKN
jgi:hypothetical protein